MKKYTNILSECPLFNHINAENLIGMLRCLDAKVEFFDKKYTIFAEGRPVKQLGIVLSGCVQIEQVDYYGNRSIIGSFGQSEVFAEAFAMANVSHFPVSVVANEPSEIMLIDAERILHTCEKNCSFHQQIIYNLMRELAVKTLMFHQRIEVTSKRTTREKLMAYLMLQAKKNESHSFKIPFDRQQLADYLEVDRAGLSTEIGKLKKEGIIACKKNRFELL